MPTGLQKPAPPSDNKRWKIVDALIETLHTILAVNRAFDPYLSCSTHALGGIPLHFQPLGPDGSLLDELKRNE